jgi:septum formation protein
MEISFEVVPSPAEELVSEQLTAVELCQLNAYRKARAVAKKLPDNLVMGVDTLVTLGSVIYGKPRDMEDAARILGKLQGRTHLVVTGVCLVHLRRHRQKIFAEGTLVSFQRLSQEAIRAYHARVQPLDKAGAYAIQEGAEDIVRSVNGSYRNVVGLPSERLLEELKAFEV